MIASENLSSVLRNVGIIAASDIIDSHSDFHKLFRHVWADHANIIALQYASSQALKTDLTIYPMLFALMTDLTYRL